MDSETEAKASQITEAVAKDYGFSIELIKGFLRGERLVKARSEVIKSLRRELSLSDTEIAKFLGRDRTTIVNLRMK